MNSASFQVLNQSESSPHSAVCEGGTHYQALHQEFNLWIYDLMAKYDIGCTSLIPDTQ
jgi:hypothetical protein